MNTLYTSYVGGGTVIYIRNHNVLVWRIPKNASTAMRNFVHAKYAELLRYNQTGIENPQGVNFLGGHIENWETLRIAIILRDPADRFFSAYNQEEQYVQSFYNFTLKNHSPEDFLTVENLHFLPQLSFMPNLNEKVCEHKFTNHENWNTVIEKAGYENYTQGMDHRFYFFKLNRDTNIIQEIVDTFDLYDLDTDKILKKQNVAAQSKHITMHKAQQYAEILYPYDYQLINNVTFCNQ